MKGFPFEKNYFSVIYVLELEKESIKVVLCMQYGVSIERKPSRRKMIIENENFE